MMLTQLSKEEQLVPGLDGGLWYRQEEARSPKKGGNKGKEKKLRVWLLV